MFYIFVITVATAIIAAANALFVAPVYEMNGWLPALYTVATVVGVIAIDGVTAFLVNRLPKKWFNHHFKIFTVGAKEKKFYEKLKIRKWKDKIPELGALGGFRKNQISDPFNNAYVERYLQEVAYGEVVHFASLFVGFFVLLFFPRFWLTIGLPVAVVNLLMNLPSLFILRYNSHKLEVLFKSNERKAARAKQKAEEAKQTQAEEEAAATE